MRIEMHFFKTTGKYYSSAHVHAAIQTMEDAWTFAKDYRDHHFRSKFIMYVAVPEHPDNHPKLIF